MFTGIIEEVGKIVSLNDSSEGRKLKIAGRKVTEDVKLGDSIAVSGACLTVVEFGTDWLVFEASFETLRRTKLGRLKIGSGVNLERALKMTSRIDGHIVSGHVDGLASLKSVRNEGFSKVLEFNCAAAFAPYFVEKGSVAVDGISLTVAGLSETSDGEFTFSVVIVPHTLSETTLSEIKIGEDVNIEADIIGKYVDRWLSTRGGQKINKESLTLAVLAEHGYT